jgi:hypothetical protein
MGRRLTIQQQKFADLKIKHSDWSDAKCYQEAYPKTKSIKVAESAASRLLRNVKVSNYLDRIREKAERESALSLEKILNRWNDIADFDVRKLFSDNNTIKNIKDIDDKTAAAISGIKVKGIIKQGHEGMELKGGEVEVKTIDIKGTLADAAKHLGAFNTEDKKGKFDFEDILNAFPEDYATQVRAELRILLTKGGAMESGKQGKLLEIPG